MKTVSTPPRFRPHARSLRSLGFTLIELLTVVAIVFVLTSIAFGAFSRIQKGSAQSAKCVSNLRATANAAIQYFTDNNGEFFTAKTWYCYPSWGPNGWVGMRDYLGVDSSNLDTMAEEFRHDSIITCPAIKSRFQKQYPMFLNMGFGMNYFLNVNDPASHYNADNRPKLAGAPGRIQNVPKLSKMWIFTDIAGNRVDRGGEFFSDIGPNSEQYMYFPHNNRQNVAFLDGHIESLSKNEWSNPPSKREFWGNLLEEN